MELKADNQLFNQKMKRISNGINPKKEYLNIWSKIKTVLKKKGIKEKEKLLYKESIGFELIDKNK